MRSAILFVAALVLYGCGAGKAVRETGQLFDKYGCISRDFKGEPPCAQPAP
jgi:hypothetical protein